jgi:VanZ family protein
MKFQFGYLVAAVGYMTGVFLLSSSEASIGPSSILLTKVLHIPLFAGLAGCLLLAVTGGQWYRTLSIQAYMLVAVLAVGYAAADEWHQSFNADRVAAVGDFLLNCVGVGLAIVIQLMVARRMARKRETSS